MGDLTCLWALTDRINPQCIPGVNQPWIGRTNDQYYWWFHSKRGIINELISIYALSSMFFGLPGYTDACTWPFDVLKKKSNSMFLKIWVGGLGKLEVHSDSSSFDSSFPSFNSFSCWICYLQLVSQGISCQLGGCDEVICLQHRSWSSSTEAKSWELLQRFWPRTRLEGMGMALRFQGWVCDWNRISRSTTMICDWNAKSVTSVWLLQSTPIRSLT